MIKHRVRGLTIIHYAIQCIVGICIFWIWLLTVAFEFRGSSGLQFQRYGLYSLIIAAACVLNLLRSKVGRINLFQLSLLSNHRLTLSQVFTIVGALLLFLFAARDGTMSRVFFFTFVPILYLYLYLTNKYLPRLLARALFHQRHRHSTILLGSGETSLRLQHWLKRKAVYGLDTAGLITYDGGEGEVNGLPVLGGLADLERVLETTHASQLIVLELPESFDRIAYFSDVCDRLGVRLLILHDLDERLNRTVSFVEDEGFHFLNLRQEPLECPINRLVKRGLDIALALPVVLFILPPVCVVVWLIHRWQAPGPLLFRQLRSGIRGSKFEIFKFRTMFVDNGDEAKQATESDPRIFRAGRWLRKLSVDELPQFINVLNGEMSIVGPRPHLMHHDVLFGQIARYYKVRSYIKPGITGLAQVRGLRGEARREKDLVERIQSDLYYLENWSIVMDVFIISKTAAQMVMPPRTAY